MATPPLIPRIEEQSANGLPEWIGTIIGTVIFVITCSLVLWPIMRRFF